MNAAKSREVFAKGQSVWYDNISRALLDDGTLKSLIDSGAIYGVTTNPSIFAKAIPQSVYDAAISGFASKGFSTRQIFDCLTVADVQNAADLFRDLYEATCWADGYVSLEVSPELADNTEETIRDVKRLSAMVDRPNVMFKIPGTKAGIPAIRSLTAEGFCINVTLLFDVVQYEAAAQAYLDGLAEFISNHGDARKVNSVASIFVSRIDVAIDKALDAINSPEAANIRGKSGIAIMKEVYSRYCGLFGTVSFGAMKAKGARIQRVLWASTSAKDPSFSPTKYVDGLIAPDTVNTIPPATLDEFLKSGCTDIAFSGAPCFGELDAFAELGIDVRSVCAELQQKGVKAFVDSFDGVLATLDEKVKQLG